MGEIKRFKTTAEIKVGDKIIDQVIGQDDAVEIMRKAAKQRRHVLLIGLPGCGKSMLGLGLAEMLPRSDLKDIVAFANPNDEHAPLIREVNAGEGRKMTSAARASAKSIFGGRNLLFFVLVVIAMLVPWYYLNKGQEIVFAAMFIGGMIFLGAFVIFINMSRKSGAGSQVPKVIVDNYNKKNAPFNDATGAHAGALLGDVLHDPFQSLFSSNKICLVDDNNQYANVTSNKLIDTYFLKNKKDIIKKKKQNYEAIFLSENELSVLGETQGLVSPVDVLSCNRYDHDGHMIKLTTSENKELIVTQEHKIALWKSKKLIYVEAKEIKKGDQVVAQAEDIIIDEQDIINTYDQRQQDQCRLYYQYLDLKAKNPTWGYKRIAKAMGQNISKTRWWHNGKHIPVPIKTTNWLKQKELLPLKIDHSKLPVIAKVLGATFGDGGVFENLNGIFLSSSEKDAVEEFGRDLEHIFGLNKNENSRVIEGGEYGHSWCYQNTNRNIIRFFLALGTPKGKKTNITLKVPKWISLQDNLEDEFFGSFFGGELGTPIIHKNGNHLTTLEIGITGKRGVDENRYEFLRQISSYLIRRNICTTSIYTRQLDENSKIYRLQIGKKMDNVLQFMMNIKINYCKYKVERLYNALGQWAMLKKNKYQELIKRGYGAEHAMKTLNLTPNSLYLLLNHFGTEQEAKT
ncbi:MAG: ATP-binding protein [Nanoarchaeota archaeon]|nr:ATP-binding protein [Nanoarchaeota archaeon]